jgi:hypothetical protein
MKRLSPFILVAVLALFTASSAQELAVQNRVIPRGSVGRVNFNLSTPVPVRGIELKIAYASDSLQPRWSFWINWDRFPNWISAQNVGNDTDHVALISKIPFQGNAQLGSIRVRLAKYVPTGMQLRLNVVATLNDTIVARYTGGYITAGPVIDNFGDMNEDGRYTTGDANRVLDIAIPDSALTLSLWDSLKADVSGDQFIDTYDAWEVLERVVYSGFRFEVEDWQGSSTGVPAKGEAGLIIENVGGLIKVYFPEGIDIHNGEISFNAPASSIQIGDGLNSAIWKQQSSNGKIRLGFITSGTIPFNQPILTLRGLRSENLNLSGKVNDGIKINPVIQNPTGVKENGRIPLVFSLLQNYPNPFNPTTTISFAAPKAGKATLKVYDLLGREMATLVDGEVPAGNQEAVFDASKFSSGTYIYRLVAGEFTEAKRMVLLK